MDLPKRKSNRLADYDYSTPNAYFVTICTDKRKNLFWENVDKTILSLRDIELSRYGEIVLAAISEIPKYYPDVNIKKFTIMPNHIHLIIQIETGENGRPVSAPTISKILGRLKSLTSRKAGVILWQKGFYDHVIRDENDYIDKREYIIRNPSKWIEDELYIKQDR